MAPRSKTNIRQKSDEQFKKAIEWLENGGTKKGACDILGVNSNSVMERLIQEWKDDQAFTAEMRKKKRGTTLDGVELANILEAYLAGDSITEISRRTFRSEALINNTVLKYGANLRYNGTISPSKPLELYPPEIPDEVMTDELEVGQKVWVSAYQCLGEVMKKMNDDVYRVYLLSESEQKYVHQYVWDLGSMKPFEELGVDVDRLGYRWSREDTITLLNEAVQAALKLNKEEKGKK